MYSGTKNVAVVKQSDSLSDNKAISKSILVDLVYNWYSLQLLILTTKNNFFLPIFFIKQQNIYTTRLSGVKWSSLCI